MIKFLQTFKSLSKKNLVKNSFLLSLIFFSPIAFGQKIKNESSVCGSIKVTPYKEFKVSNSFSCTEQKALTSCQAQIETEDGFTHISSVIIHSKTGAKYQGSCKTTKGVNFIIFDALPDLGIGEKYTVESSYKSNLYKNNDGKDNANGVDSEIEDQSSKKINITFTAKCAGLANKSTISNSCIFNTKPCITKGSVLSPTFCNGKDGYIKINGLLSSKNYKVNYLKNGVQLSVNINSDALGVITINNLSSGVYTSINVNLGSLTSNTLADKITLTNPSLKTISKGTFTSPSICGGTDGNILINGFNNNTVYGINYTKNGIVQNSMYTSSATGIISIPNLSIGEYTNFFATLNECKTNVIIDKIALVNPVLKTITKSTFVSPTTCGGTNGSIALAGFNNLTNYKVYYTKNGVQTSLALTSNSTGIIVVSNLSSGEYTNFYATLNGCTTNTITDKITLIDPVLKGITKGTVTSPTTCAGTNGSILINGLNANTTYNLTFTKNNQTTNVTIKSSTAGVLTLSNLSAGEYSNLNTSLLNCNTNTITEKITLVNPPLKNIAKGTFVSPKSCSSKDGSINLTGFTSNTNYDITYTKNGVNTISNITSTSSGIISITGLNAAEYSNFTGSMNGCNTNTIVEKITLVNPTSPTITKGNIISPSACNAFDGSIQLNGLIKNSIYSITYSKNNVTSSASSTTSANGLLTISNLGAGEYSNIYVTLGGCMSNLISDKISLTNPAIPSLTKGNVVNTSSCSQKDGSIEIKGFDNSKSYVLNYKKDGIDFKVQQTSSTTGIIKLTNLETANYSNFYTTVKACNSNIITENIAIINPINITLAIEKITNTTSCTIKDGAIQLNGLGINTSYSCKYTKNNVNSSVIINSNGAGIASLQNLEAGEYSNLYVAINGCVSNTISDKITIATPSIPTFTLNESTSPSKCLTNDGVINFSTSALNSEHIISYSKNGVNTSNTINSENSVLILSNLEKGEYSNFYIQVKGCVSSTNTSKIILTEPITPIISKGIFSNPTNCILKDGVIEINGLMKGTNYTLNYSKDGNDTQNDILADNNGTIKIGNLEPATYKDFKVSTLNCVSNVLNETITLTNPVTLNISLGGATNTTNCTKDDGTIQIKGLDANSTYDYNFTENGSNIGSTITTDVNGNATFTGLEAGVYSNFIFTSKGCNSNILLNEVQINTPSQPVFSIVGSVNPTKCNSNDGFITLKSSGSNSDYTVNFSKNDGDNTFDTKSVGNIIILSNLGEGNYSDFSINLAGCLSKVDTTLIKLVEPAIQTISILKSLNPSTCNSNDGEITIGGLTKSSNYILHFIKNKYSIDTNITSNENGSIVISNLEIADYTQFSVDANDCSSNTIFDTISFVNPIKNIISKESVNNTSNCQLNDGAIALKGTQSGKTYQVTYLKDDVTYETEIIASNKGIINLTNLSTGEYSLFKVSIGGCISNELNEIIKISSPLSPSFTIKNQVSPSTCGGIEGKIELAIEMDNNYIVNYTKNGFYTTKTITSINKSIIIDNLDQATYSNFYITSNGCSSTTNNSTVKLKEPTPEIISIKEFSNPNTCLSNDGKIQLKGMESSSNYTLNYTKNGNVITNSLNSSSKGELEIINLEAALYSNFTVQKNNCISNTVSDVITINDPSSPKLILGNSISPTICNGNDGLIEFKGLEKNLEYTLTYQSTSGNSINKISSSTNGTLALLNLKPGVYSTFSVTYNDCQSNIVSDVVSLTNSSIPAFKLGAVTSPSTCSSCNGQIQLTGLIKNNTYTATYKRNDEIESRDFTTDNSGDGFISSLSEGIYTELAVSQNTCQSPSLENKIVITAKPSSSSSSCKNILVNIEENGVKNVTCSGINDGTITFTISNGSSNNLYRIRKKNYNGTFTVVTFPAYSPVGNLENEIKTVTVGGLGIGEYDLYAFCNEDPTKYNTKYFTIGKDICTGPISYTCEGLQVALNKSDIVPASCNSDNDGSILFTVSGGFPKNVYRIRKKNSDGSFTVVTTPTFAPINNISNEIKEVIVTNLAMGDYDLYVYCANDANKYKSLTFTIGKTKCTLVKTDMIAYYPFKGNAKDESGNNHDAITNCVDLTMDNYNDPKGAYLLDGINDNISVKNLVDIDTLKGYTYSIWYKLTELPKNDGSTLLSMPNGNGTNRLDLSIDADGVISYNFGNGSSSKSIRSAIVSTLNNWNHITITHDNKSNSFYYNGKLIASSDAYALSNNTNDLVIGYIGNDKTVKASVDEIRVYKRAITETEVQTIYLNEAVENCAGIRLSIDTKSQAHTLTFTVLNGSANNKYRLRKKNDNGVFVSVYTPTYLSLNNIIGETKTMTITDLTDGIYDIYAYCGTDGTKYQGYQFVISNGAKMIQTVTTPNGTIKYVEEKQLTEEYAGINENENAVESKFTIYPNPTDNFVYISAEEGEIIKFVRVYNTSGQLVYEGIRAEDNLEKCINVSSWSSGNYVLEIFLENKPSVRKNFILK